MTRSLPAEGLTAIGELMDNFRSRLRRLKEEASEANKSRSKEKYLERKADVTFAAAEEVEDEEEEEVENGMEEDAEEEGVKTE